MRFSTDHEGHFNQKSFDAEGYSCENRAVLKLATYSGYAREQAMLTSADARLCADTTTHSGVFGVTPNNPRGQVVA
jgi:hypothetical protein